MRAWSALLAGLAAGCTMSTSAADGYTRAEVDAKLDALEQSLTFLDDVAPDGRCPPGFVAGTDDGVSVCARTLGDGSEDVMVKVGDFWIDRYETSICGDGPIACSIADRLPEMNMTWFTAAELCADAGKHLCTGAEWQTAVAGTPDPGDCWTTAAALRMTGAAVECRSSHGADDLIGNLGEWVADWHQAGLQWVDPLLGEAYPWPAGYRDDLIWNLIGAATHTGTQRGLPAAAIRGGDHTSGTGAGAFAIDLRRSPTYSAPTLGARCCID